MKKRGPECALVTRRTPAHDTSGRVTPARLPLRSRCPTPASQAGAEAVPRHPYAPDPSEPVVPGPSPAPGAKHQTRSVATWTFQAGTEPPTSYFSAVPWKKQERAHRAKDESRLFAPFRGRTITDIDRQARGACLPPNPRSIYCECGRLLIHDVHGRSFLHRKWAAAQEDDGAGSTTTAVDEMIRRLRTEPGIRRLAAVTGGRSNGSGPGGLNVIAADRSTPVSASGRPTCCGTDRQPSDTVGRRRLHPWRPGISTRDNLSSPLFCIVMTLSWRSQ
ncbi:hypothetical protein MTO96_010782 [Rhipicephalus appendiculatus]